jgi:O-antigen ligase
VVPNYILFCYRRMGWKFFRHFVIFILVMLASQMAMPYYGPSWWSFIMGRFRGYFGNPNGLAIFSYLCFMFVTVLFKVKPDLFSLKGKLVTYALLIYFLIECGSRTSLTATFMFLLFFRFFGASPFLGFVMFLAFGAAVEVISGNLPAILTALGLHNYFRVDTIADGSGRYFAWNFAWNKINEEGFFLFGGGFGNDEYIMRQHYPYLRSQGHHGGVHNSYLTMWFNTGIIGVLLFFRSYMLIFLKAVKYAPYAFAIMFSTMFSVLYESWLTGSLNPFTIILLSIITVLSEEEIVNWRGTETERATDAEGRIEDSPTGTVPQLILPAR